MQSLSPLALFPAPLDEAAGEIGRNVSADLLATMPEILRRARLGEYVNDEQAQAETGLSARQLRHLRERRAIAFSKVGRTVVYPVKALFALIDAGRVPARESVPG